MPLPPPRPDQPHYGRHLGDPDYWRPYVNAVLHRHSLPVEPLEAPFVGTFPTFIVGDVVVKLFGPDFDGERSSRVELAMLELLGAAGGMPAPGLVASGRLFDASPPWPYVVTARVRGQAIRDSGPRDALRLQVASELGALVGRLHALAPPEAVEARALLHDLRGGAPERLRRFGLPAHLVEQVADFLADAAPAEVLVHGDITADHVFVDQKGLTGVIDWGDALVADRAYELPAVYLDALAGERRHLDAFLEAAAWDPADLPRRALQGVLEFQFDAIGAIAARLDLGPVETLEELAERVFGAGADGATLCGCW